MAQKIITLYIDDSGLRLLVTHGKRIKKWAELSLEPGLIKNGVVIKEAEVAAKIRQLFKEQKVKPRKVMVGVSGLHCLSRPITLPQLPKAMLAEAVKREAKRVLPVPLEQLYLSWQIIPAAEGKTQVFLVAIPVKTADVLLQTLRQAGLKPYLMDIKPLLLARVVREATAIMVDVQPTEFDIVIMVEGVPQPIRTVSLPRAALPWLEKLPMVRDELDKTIKFYNANNPQKHLASSVPIFASGELANEPELCQSLSRELGYPVLPFPSPPLKYPEGLEPNRYLVNLGLTLKKLSLVKEIPLVVNLNVLPPAYQPKPISLTRVLALPGAATAIGLVAALVLIIQAASADIASIHSQLNITDELLRQKLAQRQELTENIAELEKEIAKAQTSRDNFTLALATLERQTREVNGNLEVVLSNLPPTVSLGSISQSEGTLTIRGRASREEEILSYLKKLDASGRFSQINIAGLRSEGGETDFTLTLGSREEPDGEVSGSLGVVISSLPSAVSLESITQSDGTLTINGWAPGEEEVLSYLKNLDASGKFSEITITSLKRIEGKGMDFTLTLSRGGES